MKAGSTEYRVCIIPFGVVQEATGVHVDCNLPSDQLLLITPYHTKLGSTTSGDYPSTFRDVKSVVGKVCNALAH